MSTLANKATKALNDVIGSSYLIESNEITMTGNIDEGYIARILDDEKIEGVYDVEGNELKDVIKAYKEVDGGDGYDQCVEYHDPQSCNKCSKTNNLVVVDNVDRHMTECKTVCKACGHTDYWAYGWFESSSEMVSKCKTYKNAQTI